MICSNCGHVHIPKNYVKEDVIKVVARFYNIHPEIMFSVCRREAPRLRRQITQYLLYGYTLMTIKEIGRTFKQDHSTVINSRNVIQDMIDTDEDFALQIAMLLEALGSPIRSLRPKYSMGKPPKVFKEVKQKEDKPFVRQKGIYSNTTPYGIASELLKTA